MRTKEDILDNEGCYTLKRLYLEVLIDIRDNLSTTNEKLERVRDKLAGVAQNISLR